jgi:predicted ATP-grasp superfamily ATP-dependent carboligase
MRVLLSEGNSTSAREAITALGLAGHAIEICDPEPLCLGRFSRFVARVHRCPGIGRDPEGYLAFICDLLDRRRFDVLLPIHEQGLVFAKARERLMARIKLAIPSFDSYLTALDKAAFSQLLSELGIAQPETAILPSLDALPLRVALPCVLKASIATASRGTFVVRSDAELEAARAALSGDRTQILLQQWLDGPTEHVQAMFEHGRLRGIAAFAQLMAGAGGGPALKESIAPDLVERPVASIGARLRWHGALSFDYIRHGGVAHFVDCNPRLVEPMAARYAGADLTALLLAISCGEPGEAVARARSGVRTRLAIQALLGVAATTRSRAAILEHARWLAFSAGPYAGSREELTPVSIDRCAAIPLTMTALLLLARPALALTLPRRGIGRHLLTAESVARITAWGAS